MGQSRKKANHLVFRLSRRARKFMFRVIRFGYLRKGRLNLYVPLAFGLSLTFEFDFGNIPIGQ